MKNLLPPLMNTATYLRLSIPIRHFTLPADNKPRPRNPTYPIAFHSPALSEAKTLFDSLIQRYRAPPNLHFCNSFLQSYSAISNVPNSLSLLRHITQTISSVKPDRQTYHILLAQACKSPNLASATEILDLMDKHKCPPDPTTTHLVLRTLCAVNRHEQAVEFTTEFCRRKSPPNHKTYGLLLKHLCTRWDSHSMSSFMDEMSQLHQINPDLITYTVLIEHACKCDNLLEAQQLLGRLKVAGLKPDSFVYNAILKGYCKLQDETRAVEFFSQMKAEGFVPNTFTYNTLIFALSKWGKFKSALRLISVMRGKGMCPDKNSYNAMMDAICRRGDVVEAMEMMKEMQEKGCEPNETTYNCVLLGFCKSGLVEKGMELFGFMESAQMRLHCASYGALLRGLCREGRVWEAFHLFDYAIKSKSFTEVYAYPRLEITLNQLFMARKKALGGEHVFL